MKRHWLYFVVVVLVALLAAAAGLNFSWGSEPPRERTPQALPVSALLGTSFTYQDQRKLNGEPVSDRCGMQFHLYDEKTKGAWDGFALFCDELGITLKGTGAGQAADRYSIRRR